MLRIEKQVIKEVSLTRFLWAIIDSGLKRKKHIQYRSTKILKDIDMITKAKHCLEIIVVT